MLNCPVCCKEFMCVLSLYYHFPVHIPKEQRFNCSACEQIFYGKSKLRTHERTYSGECKKEKPNNNEDLNMSNEANFLDDQGDMESMGFEVPAKAQDIQKNRASTSYYDNVACYKSDQTIDYVESKDEFFDAIQISNVVQPPANRDVSSSFISNNLRQKTINDTVPQFRASSSSSKSVLCAVQGEEATQVKCEPVSKQAVEGASFRNGSEWGLADSENRPLSRKETHGNQHHHLEQVSNDTTREAVSASSGAVMLLIVNQGAWPETIKGKVQIESMPSAQLSKPYGCKACSERFLSKRSLIDHRRCHTLKPRRRGLLPCTECGKRFRSNASLTEHKYIHSENLTVTHNELQKELSDQEQNETGGRVKREIHEALYFCPHCKKVFSDASTLRHHMIKHTDECRFFCNQCTRTFKYKQCLYKHTLKKHAHEEANDSIHITSSERLKKFACQICNKVFKQECILLHHMHTHSDERPFSCGQCRKAFKTPRALQRHNVIHTSDYRFRCTVCSRGFIGLTYLKNHMRLHTGERPYACSSCDKTFNQLGSLNSHERLHLKQRNKEDWEFVCAECGEKFALCENLVKHRIKKHGGEHPFVCSKCGKGFMKAAPLRRHHIRNQNCSDNNDELSFLCCKCEKRFKTAHELKSHERIHTGERPFACAHCDKRFAGRSNRQQHEETHRVLPNRLYNCDSCSKQFTSKRSMYFHRGYHHSGKEKPFKCSECPLAFHRGAEFRVHMQRHRNLREFGCPHCDQRFNVKGDVQGHIKLVHPERLQN